MSTNQPLNSDTRSPQDALSELAVRNVKAIAEIEQNFLKNATRTDRIGSWITTRSGRISVVLVHIVWFAVWVALNSGVTSVMQPFDPFPFTFLTLVVSLEAIFLTFFVLMGQNAQSAQTDRWAHLDLQVNLLAEQEMSESLRMLKAICLDRGLHSAISPKVDEMIAKTRVEAIADALDKHRQGVTPP